MTSTTWVRSKRLTLALAMGISAIGLVGCGDGGSGVGGNVSASTKSSRAVFEIENTSGYDIKTLRIVNAGGKELAKDSFSCEADATCDLRISMPEVGTLLFYNAQGKLVGVYTMADAPQEWQHVKTSDYMLGLYLFSELRKRYPEDPEALQRGLNRFFGAYQSSDGRANRYQELGQYYRYQTLVAGVDESKFFEALHQKLEKSEVLPKGAQMVQSGQPRRNRLTAPKGISVGSSEESGCPKSVTTELAIGKLVGGIMPGLSEVFELVSIGCEAAASERLSEQLSEISTQLNEMKTQLNNLGMGIDALAGYISSQDIAKALGANDAQITTTNKYLTLYGNVIATKNPETNKDPEKQAPYGSIRMLVDKKYHGSFKDAWNKEPSIRSILSGEGNLGFTTMWAEFAKLGGSENNKTVIVSALKEACGAKEDSGAKDWVAVRKRCNAAIATYQGQILGTYLPYMAMLKDITDTLNYYSTDPKHRSDAKFIENLKLVKPGTTAAPKDTWAAQYKEVMLPQIQSALRLAEGGFVSPSLSEQALANSNSTYFDPLGGLDNELKTNLAKASLNCSTATSKPDVRMPNVEEWRWNNKESFITIKCADVADATGGPLYTSRYYYDVSSNVLNLMGVLMPAKEESMTDYRLFAEGYEPYETWVYVPTGWATFTAYNDLLTIIQQRGSRSIGHGEQNSNVLFASRPAEGGDKVFYTSVNGYPASANVGGGVSRIYMRVTENTGQKLSYVVALYAARDRTYKSFLTFQLNCANNTIGCDVAFDPREIANFKGGPKIKASMSKESGKIGYVGEYRLARIRMSQQ